ncbi:uncharacterized protein [Asterias amurensis]|uniref:uncharacterized protein n=1 Tax=Asterias amurensis TaxID=7602 RepID=UPI003AB2FB2F
MQAILVGIFLVAAFCGADATMQCYNCTLVSMTFSGQETQVGEKGCQDPFNDSNIQLVPCETSCVKSISEGSMPSIRRWCYDEPSLPTCTQMENFEILGMTVSQYCCTGDKCNSAGAIGLSLILGMTAAITALLF